jgi:hypothetical protein
VIAVVCTDRDTHEERRLGWLVEEWNADGERVFALVPWVPFGELKAGADRNPDTQRGGTLRPRKCPTCRRDVPMSQSTAARKYDERVAAGLHRLDISTR